MAKKQNPDPPIPHCPPKPRCDHPNWYPVKLNQAKFLKNVDNEMEYVWCTTISSHKCSRGGGN